MTDDEILAGILRRGLAGGYEEGFGYWFLGGPMSPTRLTIDGQLDLTEEEAEAIERITPSDPIR